VLGYYLKARLAVARHSGDAQLKEQAVAECQRVLSAHNVHIHRSVWRSLPELTNAVRIELDVCTLPEWRSLRAFV